MNAMTEAGNLMVIIWSVLIFTIGMLNLANPEMPIDGVEYTYTHPIWQSNKSLATWGGTSGYTYELYGVPHVVIDNQLPTAYRNMIMRHENCHARQILENRTRSEEECYMKMWI